MTSPGAAHELPNDAGLTGFLGAAPPPGVVGARLSLEATARAVLHGTWERQGG
ncbi:hypothetical protein [Nocardioides caldifontis]|uniref:hypothetical protein n=1 Tax=Nocardioides caldifontis TaxID=2588938 RepID=UPI001396A10E|nr:hypothetical protein [Nocardioides caldifontis]